MPELAAMQRSLGDRALWIERGVLLVLILVMVGFWTWDHREKVQLRHDLETEKLKSKGYVDDINKKQSDLNALGKKLMDKDTDWQLQVENLQKLLGEKPKIVRVVDWKTKPEPVYLPSSEPARVCPTDGKKIVLVEGDQLHAELKEIDWGTKANNNIMTGRIMCFRDTPTPLVLHTQLITEQQPGGGTGSVYVPPTEKTYRWGAGGIFDLTDSGWVAGPKVMFPPFDANLLLFKTRIEAETGLAFGASGHWLLHLGAGGRFE